MKMFVYLNILEGISYDPKPIGQYQNFTLFLNMGLEMLCLFCSKVVRNFLQDPKKIILMVNQQTFVYPIILFSNMLNFVGVDHFVERTLLYKM